MTAPTPGNRQTAVTRDAGGKKSTSFNLVASGDKCFLCGNTIGESAPIGFYQGKNSMMRCHRGCIDAMEVAGGTPRDFHAAMEAKRQAPVHTPPVHQDVVNERMQVAEAAEPQAPVQARSIKFDSLQHMQQFIAMRGPIPLQTRVAIGDYVIQAGG